MPPNDDFPLENPPARVHLEIKGRNWKEKKSGSKYWKKSRNLCFPMPFPPAALKALAEIRHKDDSPPPRKLPSRLLVLDDSTIRAPPERARVRRDVEKCALRLLVRYLHLFFAS